MKLILSWGVEAKLRTASRTRMAFGLAMLSAALSLNAQTISADQIRDKVAQAYPQLETLYRDLHASPELSYMEEKTAAKVAAQLKSRGYEVTQKVGGHGVVAVLKNGAGPTVLIRADLDGLPVKELTGLPYASQVLTKDTKGVEVHVMHACAHDIHMTSLIGTARVLSELKSQWQGTLIFIGQPAEEVGGGAKAMLADGLFTRFPKPDYCLAWHVNADLPAGSVGYTSGFTMANVDSIDITVRGIGGHGAYPHTTKDPIVIASQLVLALQTIVSREIQPTEPAVVTVGSIHGGTKHNIISDEVKLQLTVRCYSDAVRDQIHAAIRRIARGVAVTAGLPEDKMPTVTVSDEYTPATYNNPELTARAIGSLRKLLGEGNVIERKPVMGGEDFGRYGRTEDKIPIVLLWLGAVSPKTFKESMQAGKTLPSLHSPYFAPDAEPTIKTGTIGMATVALDLFNGSK